MGACAKMKKWEEAVALFVTAFSRPFGVNVEINQGDYFFCAFLAVERVYLEDILRRCQLYILGNLHNPHASKRKILWFETQDSLAWNMRQVYLVYLTMCGGGRGPTVYDIQRFIESFTLQPADLLNLDLAKNSGRYDVTFWPLPWVAMHWKALQVHWHGPWRVWKNPGLLFAIARCVCLVYNMFVPLRTLWDVLKYFGFASWTHEVCTLLELWPLPTIQGESRRAVAPMSGSSGTSCHGPNLMHAIQQEKEPLKWELWDFIGRQSRRRVRHWHDLQVATCCQLKDSLILKHVSFISSCCKSRKGTLDLDLTKYWTAPNICLCDFQPHQVWSLPFSMPLSFFASIVTTLSLNLRPNTRMVWSLQTCQHDNHPEDWQQLFTVAPILLQNIQNCPFKKGTMIETSIWSFL